MLSFSYQIGGAVPAAQPIAVSSASGAVGFTAAASTTTGGSWLQVAPTSGTTPLTVSVSLNATVIAGLAVGDYQGDITFTPTSGDTTPLVVPVMLAVTAAPQLNVNPSSLSFLYQIGGTNNDLQQSVMLTSSDAPITFGTPTVNQPWLVATPSGTVTPATITVGLQTASLTVPGAYSGTISIPVTGGPTLSIQVSVTVSNSPLLSLTPTSLTFMYVTGGATPATQTITPTSTGADVSYTVSATTATGVPWLVISTSGTTPTPIMVSINTVVLPPMSVPRPTPAPSPSRQRAPATRHSKCRSLSR